MENSPRILFVCTKFGGRSLLATHLCNRNSPRGNIAVASSFDPGNLPRSYFTLMNSLGYALESDPLPLSLFERYKRGETFDHVVVMCSEQLGEQCHIFSLSVKELYGKSASIVSWPVADLSLVMGDGGREGAMVRNIQDLEERVNSLLGHLAGNQGSADPCDNGELRQSSN